MRFGQAREPQARICCNAQEHCSLRLLARYFGLAAIVASVGITRSQAQPPEPLVIPAMLARADVVVVGRVIRDWNLDNPARVFTFRNPMPRAFTFRVDRILKGKSSQAAEIITVHVTSRMGVSAGQYGILFLARRVDGNYATIEPLSVLGAAADIGLVLPEIKTVAIIPLLKRLTHSSDTEIKRGAIDALRANNIKT